VRATDAEVVRAVLAGDVERYAVLVRRYRDRFARYAARMLGSRDVAEDAVQDALVRGVRSAGGLSGARQVWRVAVPDPAEPLLR